MAADRSPARDAVSLVKLRGEEAYFSVWPTGAGDLDAQVRSVYRELERQLAGLGIARDRVIWERLFLASSLSPPAAAALSASTAGRGGYAPARSIVLEPPCSPGRLCELQAQVLLAASGDAARVAGAAGQTGASAVVVERGGRREIHLAGVIGERGADFAREAQSTFEAAARDLASRGAGFREVARTWIHLANIGRDYAEFNRARRAFFAGQGVRLPPASTAVGGRPLPGGHGGPEEPRVSLALHAVVEGSFRPMRARTLNEAPEYGSDFSRGTRVARPGGDLLHLSGTSAVDERGRSVAVGDFEGQVDRTLRNVQTLLEEQGAGFPEVVLAVSYLKDPRHLARYLERAGPLGLLEVPHAIVQADICREELLCELEVIAIL